MHSKYYRVQKNYGITMFIIVTLVLCFNLLAAYTMMEGIDGNIGNPSIIILICFLPVIAITIVFDATWVRWLQVGILYAMSVIAIFFAVDSLWGWGLFVMSVSMALVYDLLKGGMFYKILASLFVLICMGAVGLWLRDKCFVQSIYSFITVFFFILMGCSFAPLFMENRQKISLLEETIEAQNKAMEKLTENQSSLTVWVHGEQMKTLLTSLTDKELTLLESFCKSQGRLTNKEIANLLMMTEQGVKSAFFRIMKKLEVSSRAELLAKYGDKYLSKPQ